MDKKELYQYVGSMQQMAYIRKVTCEEGRSTGLRMFDVKNECLQYQVMCDKCLDVAGLTYKGINMNFLSKPGLQGRNHYDTNGQEALRSIMGGLFFTAGMENICAPYKNEAGEYPMHGRIRTTPAEQVSSKQEWTKNGLVLKVSGTMREAELFGENMVLHRTIETTVGTKSLKVTDEVENEAFREEPLMLLYHINLGYPFLPLRQSFIFRQKKWHHETKLPPDTRQIMTTWTGRKRMSRSMCLSTISRRQRIREPGSLR